MQSDPIQSDSINCNAMWPNVRLHFYWKLRSRSHFAEWRWNRELFVSAHILSDIFVFFSFFHCLVLFLLLLLASVSASLFYSMAHFCQFDEIVERNYLVLHIAGRTFVFQSCSIVAIATQLRHTERERDVENSTIAYKKRIDLSGKRNAYRCMCMCACACDDDESVAWIAHERWK